MRQTPWICGLCRRSCLRLNTADSHKRGYRVEAVIKHEAVTLAAAVVIAVGSPQIGQPLEKQTRCEHVPSKVACGCHFVYSQGNAEQT